MKRTDLKLQQSFPPLLIRASAGTGKTFQLSSRFLELVAHGEDPSRILATTFTRKAAGEILSRVLTRLARAVINRDEQKLLIKELNLPSTTDLSKLLTTLLQNQHRLRISTLDSFFFDIAATFSLELGLIPGWKIAEPTVIGRVRSEALRLLCTEDNEKGTRSVAHLLHYGEFDRSVHARLEREIQNLHELFIESGEAAWSCLTPQKGLEKSIIEALKDQSLQLKVPLTSKNLPHGTLVKSYASMQESIGEEDWEGFLSQKIVQAIRDGADKFSKVDIDSELRELVLKLIGHARAEILTQLKYKTEASAELLKRYSGIYSILQYETGVLGFEDVRSSLLHALPKIPFQDLYYRLDNQIHHLLFDEFQDTARTDWSVLEPLVDEVLSKSGEEYSFFCVGDRKQAIYGWRGGIEEIFSHLDDRWPQLQTKSQDLSYRSSAKPLQLVNDVFSRLGTNAALKDYLEVALRWQGRFATHSTVHAAREGYVYVEQVSSEDENDVIIQRTAESIKNLVLQERDVAIGVLCRSNDSVAQIVQLLRGPPFFIDASEEGGNPLTDSASVNAVISLLKIGVDASDTISLYHVRHSFLEPIFGSYAPADLSRQIREEVAELGFGAFLRALLKEIVHELREGEQVRLAQLVELGMQYDREVDPSIHRFITFVTSTPVENTVPSAVRVMTIHKSKGLEFDAVFLPDLANKLLSNRFEWLLIDRKNALEPPSRVIRNVRAAIREYEPELKALHERHMQEKANEALNLLYVALTRSRHALYLFLKEIDVEDPPLSISGILTSALNIQLKYEIGNARWYSDLKKSIQGGLRKASAEFKLAQKPQRSRAIHFQNPSAFEGLEETKVEDKLRFISGTPLFKGKLVHQIFEKLVWSHQAPTYSFLKERLGVSHYFGLSVDDVLSQLEEALHVPEILELFQEKVQMARFKNTKVKAYCEHPFVVRQADAILSGKFDRLVTWDEAGKVIAAEVIDFKTDKIHDLDAQIDFYRPQAEAYRRAAAATYGLKPSHVSAQLVFLEGGFLRQI